MKPKSKIQVKTKKLRRDVPHRLSKKDWIVEYREISSSNNRRTILITVFGLLSISIITILAIVLLQGFHTLGFCLPLSDLRFFEGTMLGEVATMAGIMVRFLFS